jgi:hypothetical protein
MDYVNWFLSAGNYAYGNLVRNTFFCNDGAVVSIQASEGHYCQPRENNASEYTDVELGFPERFTDEDLIDLKEYEDDGVFGYVPIEVVNKIIERHGGALIY